ncbi:hypothetical protein B0H13DRAFT_1915468 [Mycena leptocephala]|nr:hypothetical protein B0H13DRAFT_1915468 [Mycena leptocephala]
MKLNGSFNTSLTDLDPHFFVEFPVNLNSDPYALMFCDSSNVPIAEEKSDDYNYLECIGPPYDMHSAPSQSVVGNEFLQGMGSTVPFDWFEAVPRAPTPSSASLDILSLSHKTVRK